MKSYELTLRGGGIMETDAPIRKITSVSGVMWCEDEEGELLLAVPLSNIAYVIAVETNHE